MHTNTNNTIHQEALTNLRTELNMLCGMNSRGENNPMEKINIYDLIPQLLVTAHKQLDNFTIVHNTQDKSLENKINKNGN